VLEFEISRKKRRCVYIKKFMGLCILQVDDDQMHTFLFQLEGSYSHAGRIGSQNEAFNNKLWECPHSPKIVCIRTPPAPCKGATVTSVSVNNCTLEVIICEKMEGTGQQTSKIHFSLKTHFFAIGLIKVKHLEKFLGIFDGHLICINISSRKEKRKDLTPSP